MYIDFLQDIDKETYNRLITNVKRYNKGTTIYQKGSACSGIDIVLSGSLVAYATSENGSESRVFSFEQEHVLGANLLFGRTGCYPLNIYATSDCELLRIEKADVEILLHNYNFAMKFIQNISLNSQGMNQKIAMSTQKTLRENILEYLEKLSKEQNTRTIKLPISKKQLADYLGVQRPSLFRELKKLNDEGVLVIDNKNISLL